MKKNWLLAGGLVLVLATVGLIGCGPGSSVLGEIREINLGGQQTGIWVTGQGKVSVAPDVATLRLGIESQEARVAEAQTKAKAAMDEVMAALTEKGVADKDIQTRYFNIQKVTKWDRDREQEIVIGYRVTNLVTAKIRDMDKTGTIIDAVAKAGGDLTRIDSINFSVDDPSEYYGEAREKAMADAKAKAQQLAGLADVTLGKSTYISESSQAQPIYAYRGEMAVSAPAPVETPISPGEVEISLSVQVVYAIK